MMQLEMPQCEHGSPAIMMRIAGTEANMKNMVIWQKPLAVFSCTWNGIPLIYSGQELPNLKRLKFFEKDAIDWTGENAKLA